MKENINFTKSGNAIEKQIEQKQQETFEKNLKKMERYIEKMERLYYEAIKENKKLKKELQEIKERDQLREEQIKELGNRLNVSTQFSKALAYSTNRFLPDSIHLIEPEKLIKLTQKYDLKDPEQYPIGTYRARKERLRTILEWIKEKGRTTTRELVNKFNICNPTARADMRDLLDAFPKALTLFIPKSRGRESYILEVRSNPTWGLSWVPF